MKTIFTICLMLLAQIAFSQTDLKLLKNINPSGNAIVSFDELGYWAKVNNVIYFSADDGVHGRELWKTDGTAAGTKMIKDIFPGAESGLPYGGLFHQVGNYVFFVTSQTDNGILPSMWRTDGTEAGTFPIITYHANVIDNSTIVCDNKFYSYNKYASTSEVVVSDGTIAGTRVLNVPTAYAEFRSCINNLAYFTVYNSISDYELWRTDGTSEGTFILKDNMPYEEWWEDGFFQRTFYPLSFSFHNKFYFSFAGDVWTSDGTVSGTAFHKAFDDVESFGYSHRLGENVYFTRGASTLWRTNGTDWVALRAFECALPANFVTLNGEDYFLYYYGDCTENPHMQELWKTDGTPEGTVLVKNAGFPTFTTKPMAVIDNKIYFEGHDAEHGDDLWVSDGTAAGTHFVKELGVGDIRIDLIRFTQTTSGTYFLANDAAGNRQLWKLTGGECHTRQVTFGKQQISEITQLNNALIMSAITQEHGELELYYLDIGNEPDSDCAVISVDEKVNIYPNPSTQKIFTIISERSFDFTISNAQGKIIHKGSKDKNDAVIDLKTFPAGSYIFTAFTSKGTIHRKIILR